MKISEMLEVYTWEILNPSGQTITVKVRNEEEAIRQASKYYGFDPDDEDQVWDFMSDVMIRKTNSVV